MEMTAVLMTASGFSAVTFFVLLIAGLVSRGRRGSWLRRHGLAVAEARAAQRFARGEIDAAAFRVLRDDLRKGF